MKYVETPEANNPRLKKSDKLARQQCCRLRRGIVSRRKVRPERVSRGGLQTIDPKSESQHHRSASKSQMLRKVTLSIISIICCAELLHQPLLLKNETKRRHTLSSSGDLADSKKPGNRASLSLIVPRKRNGKTIARD